MIVIKFPFICFIVYKDESERNGQWPVGRLSQRSNDKAIEKNFETVTIKVGREAVLPCFINNLGSYKVCNISLKIFTAMVCYKKYLFKPIQCLNMNDL